MRILIASTFYYPNMQGGAEQSVKLLAEGMVKKGHEVAIFCIDSKDGKTTVSTHNGVKIYRYTANALNLYRFSYNKKSVKKLEKIQQKLVCYYNPGCLKDLEIVCKDFNPDVIHTNTTYGMTAMVWKKAYSMGIPVVHTVRDIAIVSPVQYGHKVNKLVLKAHQMYMRHFTKYATAVTAPSEYTLRTSLEIGSFKNAKVKKCIFNSVDIDHNKMQAIIEEKKARTSECIKFMYAGRLVYFKGIEHMINAFEQMEYKNCELHICGPGEMASFVEEWAEKDKRIIYHGKLNNEELSKVYDECDVLLVPSYWPEPFGRVLIEGNMHGMPVIAGNCGGMPEIIKTAKGGLVYEPGNAAELKEKMEELTNRQIYDKYWSEILKNMDIYDIIHQLDSFENVYQIICNK